MRDCTCGSHNQGVHHWHRCGYLHKDIKPSNVGIQVGTGKVLIYDANIAESIESCLKGPRRADSTLEGTDGYIAPEVLARKTWTPSGESYSVGKTIQKVRLLLFLFWIHRS